ncbi:MAG: hypothetical protein WBG54_06200 [Acidobacteriaceae bacterium]
MKRHALLAVVFLSLAANACALQADRSSYDPMAHQWQAQQHKGIVEKTLAGINPQDKNYGAVVGDWRKEVFESTLHQVYFWTLILLGMGFGISLTGNGWLLRDRERRLTISADIVTQLFNAYIGSRAKALEVIARHNALVDRYNALDGERQRLENQIAGLSEKPVQSELDFSQIRKGRGDVEEHQSMPAATVPNEPQKQEAEHTEVGSLKAQLADIETKLQRKTAQLQAKDNQITNLRERLSRAHDSLEEQRKPKAQAV